MDNQKLLRSLKLSNTNRINTSSIMFDISIALRGSCVASHTSIFAAAYALLKISENPKANLENIDTFIKSCKIPEERGLFLKDAIGECWSEIRKLQDNFSVKALKEFIIDFDPSDLLGKANDISTPISVSKLAISILGIKKGDKIIDYCSGIGNFIKDCYSINPNAKYFGIEINKNNIEIAKIRLELIGAKHQILLGNALNNNFTTPEYDVAFANYPFGMRVKDCFLGKSNTNTIFEEIPAFKKLISLDWYFNYITNKSAKRKAVCIIPVGDTFNTTEKEIRKYFIEQKVIEAIIALPGKIFSNTAIPTVMLVLSHDNQEVMMIDAKDLCLKGRRSNTLTDENINEILKCFKQESKHSKKVTYSEITNNDYVINPERYLSLETSKKLEKSITFENVIKNITRGVQLKASDLDELSSKKPTNVRYLSLANIHDGFIDDNMPYLTELDKRLEKYCIKNHSLIISKFGSPFKIAVAETDGSQKILGNGNLFIIELEETKANPYYIKAFLESEIGLATLKSIAVGTALPTIGIDQLKKIDIPDENIDKQNTFAKKYLAVADEIKLYKHKLIKSQDKLNHFFDISQEE